MTSLLENVFMKLITMYNEYTPTKTYINKILSSKLLMEEELSRNQNLAGHDIEDKRLQNAQPYTTSPKAQGSLYKREQKEQKEHKSQR